MIKAKDESLLKWQLEDPSNRMTTSEFLEFIFNVKLYPFQKRAMDEWKLERMIISKGRSNYE